MILICVTKNFRKEIFCNIILCSMFICNHVKCMKVPEYDDLDYTDEEMTSWIDFTVNPCDDFYKFACGNYHKEELPPGKIMANNFIPLRDLFEERLRDIVENDEFFEDDPKVFKEMKAFYHTCIDTEKIEKTSETDFRKILKDLGGFPLLDGNTWDESKFDWRKLSRKLNMMGYPVDHFISFNIGVDYKNTSRYIIYLEQATLGLDRGFLLLGAKEKIVRAYFKYMIDVTEILGASRVQAQKELSDSIWFEIQLANITSSHSYYNPMSLKDIQTKYPHLYWKEYINEILSPHIQVDYSDTIIVKEQSYLNSFFELVSNTPKRVLANYAMWRVTMTSSKYLGRRIHDASTEFSAALTRASVDKPRWKECINEVYRSLPVALGASYARKYVEKDTKKNVTEIMNNLKSILKKLLVKSYWMDRKTRTLALEKLDFMKTQIGYPDELLDNKKLEDYYQNLEIHPESYLKSHLSLNLHQRENRIRKFTEPVDRTDWTRHGYSLTDVAYYDLLNNVIVIPSVTLEEVFYSNEWPNYMNYGAIGSVIGHELNHVIWPLNHGGRILYDKDGIMDDWWRRETKNFFNEINQCFVHQYDKYKETEVGLKVNGTKTLLENVSDNVGVKLAYLAYRALKQKKWLEPWLSGLNYTSNQMFWISYASIYCFKYDPELLKLEINNGHHSPNQVRVNGAVSNMPEFSKDFNCPLDSKMNPSKKCIAW